MTTVLLADDHALVRAGLASLIATTDDLLVVGEAENGAEAVRLASDLLPDVVVMDLSMPVMDGMTATRLVVAAHASIKVLVLTSFPDEGYIAQALEAGAVGYLLKDGDPHDVLTGIRAAALG